MIEQIKTQRVQIDGISQLVKDLKPSNREFVVDINKIPKGWDMIKFDEILKTTGYAFQSSSDKDNPVIQEINRFKELDKCFDSLILAKGWLGELLGELGEQTPYQNDGKRKDVNDIEKTVDIFPLKGFIDELGGDWHQRTHIEKVDYLRQRIKQEIKLVIDMKFENVTTREIAISRTNVYNHLVEAKMWLGFELQRLKENNN